jgi:hypothetical protein
LLEEIDDSDAEVEEGFELRLDEGRADSSMEW